MSTRFDATAILGRLASHMYLNEDKDVSERLGCTRSDITNARHRNRFPHPLWYKIMNYCHVNDCDPLWLILGGKSASSRSYLPREKTLEVNEAIFRALQRHPSILKKNQPISKLFNIVIATWPIEDSKIDQLIAFSDEEPLSANLLSDTTSEV